MGNLFSNKSNEYSSDEYEDSNEEICITDFSDTTSKMEGNVFKWDRDLESDESEESDYTDDEEQDNVSERTEILVFIKPELVINYENRIIPEQNIFSRNSYFQVKLVKQTNFKIKDTEETHVEIQSSLTDFHTDGIIIDSVESAQPTQNKERKVQKNPLLISEVASLLYFNKPSFCNLFQVNPIHTIDGEYDMVMSLLNIESNKYTVKNIFKIGNPYIQCLFELKVAEYCYTRCFYLFHCTNPKSANSIIRENLNYRFSGRRKNSPYFGRGVYFTPDVEYAIRFCKSKEKVILVCLVLYERAHKGNPKMKVPNEGFDSTTGKTGREVIKFDDDTFCPYYKVIIQEK